MYQVTLTLKKLQINTKGIINLRISKEHWHYDLNVKSNFQKSYEWKDKKVSFSLDILHFMIEVTLQETQQMSQRLAGTLQVILSEADLEQTSSYTASISSKDPYSILSYSVSYKISILAKELSILSKSKVIKKQLIQQIQLNENTMCKLKEKKTIIVSQINQQKQLFTLNKNDGLKIRMNTLSFKIKNQSSQAQRKIAETEKILQMTTKDVGEIINTINLYGDSQICDKVIQRLKCI